MGLRKQWPAARGASDDDFDVDLDNFNEYRQIPCHLGPSELLHPTGYKKAVARLFYPSDSGWRAFFHEPESCRNFLENNDMELFGGALQHSLIVFFPTGPSKGVFI